MAQGNFLSCSRRSGIGRKKLRGKQEELDIETEHKLFINLQTKRMLRRIARSCFEVREKFLVLAVSVNKRVILRRG